MFDHATAANLAIGCAGAALLLIVGLAVMVASGAGKTRRRIERARDERDNRHG